MRLSDLGEGALIRRIRDRFPTVNATLGIGDDAALLEVPPGHSVVYCSDLMAEDTHFIRNLNPPDSVGYKAVAVNVSDVGAMGGVPTHFVLSLAAPGDLEVDWVDGFYSGIERACREFGVSLVGGDTAAAKTIFVDVSMIGRVPTGKAVRRSGARAGDKIYVTGTLGGSMRGLDLLKSGTNPGASTKRHLYPEPRHRVGAAVCGKAHAMIDVSDGLSSDLTHIIEESKVSARIYKDRLPLAQGATESEALHGGEEYELIITAPNLPSEIEGVQLSHIGEIVESAGKHQVLLIDGTNQSVIEPRGWDHYSPNR
jgi:thiamine-monophosphate kinase